MDSNQGQAYFLTVDWCNKGHRGIFCNHEGHCFRKNDKPHSIPEMGEILGPFELILEPRSELFTVDQISEFTQWIPLEEYSNEFGVALRKP